MWTMGYNDGGEFNIPTDSFNGRRLRPLIPRPNSTPTNATTPTPNCLDRLHGTDFFSLNNHLAAMGGCDQGKREATGVVVSSSRWNPTPEQLRTLEELYGRGTRTPSADQIQHITAQLRRYGKIEGKNVFYWFQNHKARERQKRRRQMEYSAPDAPLDQPQMFERKDSSPAGAIRTGFEGEQTKNWVPSTNFSTLAEESVTTSRAAEIAECCRVDGWIQLEEGELENRRSCFFERNGTWQMMQLSRPSPTHHHHHHLINPTTCCCSATTPPTTTSCTPAAATANGTGIATTTTSAAASKLPSAATKRTKDPTNQVVIKGRRDLNIFIAPYRPTGDAALINHFRHSAISEDEEDGEDEEEGAFDSFAESQTLQLFPLRSCGDTNSSIIVNQKFTDASSVAAAMNNNASSLMTSSTSSSCSSASPCPFFEFLPLMK